MGGVDSWRQQRSARVVRIPELASTPRIGRGDDTVGNPHRAQISQLGFFELIEIKQTVPCRAIRGDGNSVNSTLPHSYCRSRLLRKAGDDQIFVFDLRSLFQRTVASVAVRPGWWKSIFEFDKVILQ